MYEKETAEEFRRLLSPEDVGKHVRGIALNLVDVRVSDKELLRVMGEDFIGLPMIQRVSATLTVRLNQHNLASLEEGFFSIEDGRKIYVPTQSKIGLTTPGHSGAYVIEVIGLLYDRPDRGYRSTFFFDPRRVRDVRGWP